MKKWFVMNADGLFDDEHHNTKAEALIEAEALAKESPDCIFYVAQLDSRVSCIVENPAVTEVV